MNERQFAQLHGGERHPGRFAFFVAWAATKKQPRRAIFEATALFGGVTCSLIHAHNTEEAVAAYLLGFLLALTVMKPWFFADYSIHGGWRR